MSEETDFETVRQAFAAFNRGDWEAAEELADAEIEWDAGEIAGPDNPGLIRGAADVRAMWANFFGVWDDWEIAPGEPIRASTGSILVPVQFTARGHGSGVPMTLNYFQVITLRSGKIFRVGNYLDESEASEAAGLPK